MCGAWTSVARRSRRERSSTDTPRHCELRFVRNFFSIYLTQHAQNERIAMATTRHKSQIDVPSLCHVKIKQKHKIALMIAFFLRSETAGSGWSSVPAKKSACSLQLLFKPASEIDTCLCGNDAGDTSMKNACNFTFKFEESSQVPSCPSGLLPRHSDTAAVPPRVSHHCCHLVRVVTFVEDVLEWHNTTRNRTQILRFQWSH